MNHSANHDTANHDAAADERVATQSIVVDEVFPHAPEEIWKILTSADLIARWMMAPVGFAPVVGNRFTYQTKPAGAWDGTIFCEVLEVVANECLAHSWRGGHEDNVGYGSLLDTVVRWTLTRLENGTRLRMEHAGFIVPKNDSALSSMGQAWKTVVQRVGTMGATEH